MNDHNAWKFSLRILRPAQLSIYFSTTLRRLVRDSLNRQPWLVLRNLNFIKVVWHHRAHQGRQGNAADGIYGKSLDEFPPVDSDMRIVVVQLTGRLPDLVFLHLVHNGDGLLAAEPFGPPLLWIWYLKLH